MRRGQVIVQIKAQGMAATELAHILSAVSAPYRDGSGDNAVRVRTLKDGTLSVYNDGWQGARFQADGRPGRP